MKKILIIGSAVADVIIRVDHLPAKSEDVHVISQEIRMGGCGYNVCDMIRHFNAPYIPFFPIGKGPYANFVRSSFQKNGIPLILPSADSDNGCCYCFVENDGERTFISHHGAEYRFLPEWFDLLDVNAVGSVYICGIEIEEDTGIHIIEFLEKLHHASSQTEIYFAPGPRILKIGEEKMQRLLALSPVLHLNKDELLQYTLCDDLHKAAASLSFVTGNAVLTTLGKDGCLYTDTNRQFIAPGEPAVQRDTIGAGDAHIGAVIASRHLGHSFEEALRIANRICARVVEVPGALLNDEQFSALL